MIPYDRIVERVQAAITSAAAWGDPREMARAAIEAIPEPSPRWSNPQISGVGRMLDNDKAVLLMFKRPLTDDELRGLHEFLRGFRS